MEDYDRASINKKDEIGRLGFAEKKGEIKGKIEVIKSAKKRGLSIIDIVKLTGLTED